MARDSLEAALNGPNSRIVHIVDDDDAVRDSMRVFLESFGMSVRDYASAHDFLGADGADDKGCLVLDLHMPGMNGLELLEMLRGRGSDVPAIVVTGRGDPVLKERARRAGALVLLDKPVDESVLLSAIDRAFVQAP
jgi:FixJ family two-component response regulator